MAFNPFHGFRKHQKGFFAALTILCMFIFVLGGASGYFRELTTLFGGKGRGGTEVATLYGRPIYASQISELRFQREVANRYMMEAAFVANGAAAQKIQEGLKTAELDDRDKQTLTQIVSMRSFMFQFAAQSPDFVRQQIQQSLQQLNNLRFRLEAAKKARGVELVQQVDALLRQDAFLMLRRGEMYFGGGTKGEDLLDFLIWQHEADRLGIHFTGKDVGQLVIQDTGNMLPADGLVRVNDQLRQYYRGINSEQLKNFVADEFRVRLAQRALMGAEANVYDREPSALTPYDLWGYFKEQRTESRIALLPIPVDQKAFIDKVKDPTEEELKNFFGQNKYRVFDPSKDEAGFKVPTRVEVGWVRAKPDAPFYREAAAIVAGLTRATLPVAAEAKLYDDYDKSKYLYESPSWVENRFQFKPHDTSVGRPANVAGMVGQALAGGPAVLSGWMSYQGAAAYHEVAGRIRAGASVLLAGSAESPLAVLGTFAAGQPASRYEPLDKVKSILLENQRETLARELAAKSVTALQDELQSLSRQKAEDRAKNAHAAALLGQALASAGSSGLEMMAQGVYESGQKALVQHDIDRMATGFAFAATAGSAPWTVAALLYREDNLAGVEARHRIEAAVKKYGLEYGASQEPRDRYHIGDDPGLDPLRRAFEGPWGTTHRSETNTKLFAGEVYRAVEQGGAFVPHQLSGNTEFLYWKSGERAAYVPAFAEVKGEVLARWKFEKARALAKEEAERVVKKIPSNATGADAEMTLRDASPQAGGTVFELDHVARLTQEPVAMMGQAPRGYSRYKVPPSKVEYPSAAMTRELLALNKEGQAVVLHDQPEATYYVAVLVSRSTPYELTFFSEARNPFDLLMNYDRDTKARAEERKSFREQLERQARLTVDKNELKKLERGGGSMGE